MAYSYPFMLYLKKKPKTYRQKSTVDLTTVNESLIVMQSSGCRVHHLAAEFCSAAAVELFGGSLQIVVVVLASLHSSLLEAFDLFTVSSVRVCTIFSHGSSSLVPTTEIRSSWPQRACEMCLLVVGVCGPRGRNRQQADKAERRDDDIKQ